MIEGTTKYHIKSLHKAISILEWLAMERRDLSLTEIARSLGMGKGTVHRFLNTLKERRFIQQDPETHKYGFGIRAYDLGMGIRRDTLLKNLMLPHLRQLAARSAESVNAAILDQDEIIYIIYLASEETLPFYHHEGTRLPATCTAPGKVLLASLPNEVLLRMYAEKSRFKRQTKHSIASWEQFLKVLGGVRKRNLAFDREECDLGVCSLAAPVRNFKKDVAAAISITAPKIRMTKERVAEFSQLLTQTAEEISGEF